MRGGSMGMRGGRGGMSPNGMMGMPMGGMGMGAMPGQMGGMNMGMPQMGAGIGMPGKLLLILPIIQPVRRRMCKATVAIYYELIAHLYPTLNSDLPVCTSGHYP